MDPKFVNLLIQQFIDKTTCPQCGSAILPINVKVENTGKDACVFSMQCKKCNAVIAADAHLAEHQEKTVNTDKTKEKQKTSPLAKPVKKQIQRQAVSLDDLMQMKKHIQNFSGNFKTLFQ